MGCFASTPAAGEKMGDVEKINENGNSNCTNCKDCMLSVCLSVDGVWADEMCGVGHSCTNCKGIYFSRSRLPSPQHIHSSYPPHLINYMKLTSTQIVQAATPAAPARAA
jgi:hypothetical protein